MINKTGNAYENLFNGVFNRLPETARFVLNNVFRNEMHN